MLESSAMSNATSSKPHEIVVHKLLDNPPSTPKVVIVQDRAENGTVVTAGAYYRNGVWKGAVTHDVLPAHAFTKEAIWFESILK